MLLLLLLVLEIAPLLVLLVLLLSLLFFFYKDACAPACLNVRAIYHSKKIKDEDLHSICPEEGEEKEVYVNTNDG